jgi:hypothetical protein
MEKKVYWLSLTVGLLYFAFAAWTLRGYVLRGNVDFLQLYAGARLAGSPSLYDKHASLAIHKEVTGRYSEGVFYSRIPIYAWALKPLGKMPFRAAFWLFVSLNLLGFAWFMREFAAREPLLAILGWLYPPLTAALINGQDLGLLAAIAAAGYLLLDRKRPFAAGLIWSLCAIKPHLFLLVPLALAIRRQWRALCGGLTGGLAILAGCYLAQGPDWIARYASLLGDPEIHPGLERMPNFQSLRLVLSPGAGSWFIWLGAASVIGLSAWISYRARDWRTAFALALPASLLASWHAYSHDLVLLLPAAGILFRHEPGARLRNLLLAAITPIPPLTLLAGAPWSAVMPLLLLAILVLAVAEPRMREMM